METAATQSLEYFLPSLERAYSSFSQSQLNSAQLSPLTKAKLLSLGQERLSSIQKNIEMVIDIKNEVEKDLPITPEFDLEMEKGMLKACSRYLGYVVDENLYKSITHEDIVEVYNQDLVQLYRSLSFFKLCSYDLVELLTHEFHELYERSIMVNSSIYELATQIKTRPYCLEPVSLRSIPQHFMREKFSPKRTSFLIEFKDAYPLYTPAKEFFGYVVVQGARKVDPEVANRVAFL